MWILTRQACLVIRPEDFFSGCKASCLYSHGMNRNVLANGPKLGSLILPVTSALYFRTRDEFHGAVSTHECCPDHPLFKLNML